MTAIIKPDTIIQKVSIIGSGNVAGHLGQAFLRSGLEVVEICSPNQEHARVLADDLHAGVARSAGDMRTDADLYLLAVPDARVGTAASGLPMVEGIVVHTSGNTPLDVLERFPRHGVFYPLQTFTRGRAADLSSVPFCLEASDREVLEALAELASRLTSEVHFITSAQRKILHLSAVLVNNFSNHLYHLAEEFLKENQLDFGMLRPLISETAGKVLDLSPEEAQTGPASRGDAGTISTHLEMLHDHPDILELYKLMSEQISKQNHE